jgi:hypothetical protein
MLLTFNSPSIPVKSARMTSTNTKSFGSYTPAYQRKMPNHSNGKKAMEGGLCIVGRQAGEMKSESMYEPDKYNHKSGLYRK